nr:acyl-CoA dehydrogenase family protein [Enterovibrio norvegicus]
MAMINLDRYAATYGEKYGEHIEWLREVASAVDNYQDIHGNTDFRNEQLDALLLSSFSMTTEERVRMFEQLSYGDPGALLFSPGPSLSGVILNEAGSEEQKAQFYDYLKEHNCRTFFAVTEPSKGSDAGRLESRYTEGTLSGEKWLIGNGTKGDMGVVLFKTGASPLATRAALLTKDMIESPQVERRLLKQHCLRGARLSYLKFDGLPIPQEQLLGEHLHPCERGLFSMIRTFNKMRPCVVGLSIGYAQAAVDVLLDHGKDAGIPLEACRHFNTILATIRDVNLVAAQTADKEPDNMAYSSLAKIELDDLVKQMRPFLFQHFSKLQSDHFTHVRKFMRDSYAFDFMEGTHVIQKHNLVNILKRNDYVSPWSGL